MRLQHTRSGASMVEHTISHTVLQLPSFNSTTKQALLPTWRVVSSSAAADEDSTPARFSACSPSATCKAQGSSGASHRLSIRTCLRERLTALAQSTQVSPSTRDVAIK